MSISYDGPNGSLFISRLLHNSEFRRHWGMRFQLVKCNIMQITRKRIKKINASYTLEGTVLDNVEKIKYLGITITNDLNGTHVSNICRKVNRTLGFLRRNLAACALMLSQHTRDWCIQSWSMLVQFGPPRYTSSR